MAGASTSTSTSINNFEIPNDLNLTETQRQDLLKMLEVLDIEMLEEEENWTDISEPNADVVVTDMDSCGADALARKFEVKLSDTGRVEIGKLITHFEINGKPDYLLKKYADFINPKTKPKVVDLFEKQTRKSAASLLRKMCEAIKAVEPEDHECTVTMDEYDVKIIQYIGGYLIKKGRKHKKKDLWNGLLTSITGDSQAVEDYSFLAKMNVKYRGYLYAPTNELLAYLKAIYLLVLQECKSKMQRANLLKLYSLAAESVAYQAFLNYLNEEGNSNAETDKFLEYITNLFIRVLFFRYVKRLTNKIVKGQEGKARALRETVPR